MQECALHHGNQFAEVMGRLTVTIVTSKMPDVETLNSQWNTKGNAIKVIIKVMEHFLINTSLNADEYSPKFRNEVLPKSENLN